MSRSCQSATFSRPTSACALRTRARPQMRSATIGFRLWGIAEDPFWPRPKGSSTSRTSVRARWRISVAKRSSDEPRSARAPSNSACRCRIEPELLARNALDLGVDGCILAHSARELADAEPFERSLDARPFAVQRERPADQLQPERRRLGIHAVRSTHAERVAMLLGSRD